MGENKEIKESHQTTLQGADKALGWLETILKLMKKFGTTKVLGALLIITIMFSFFYAMFNIDKVFEIYDNWEQRRHDAKMEQRMEMAPRIQSLIDKLTFRVNASRTLVLELHNGNTGNGGLPFTKCTATYESLNLAVHPVAQEYQDVNMSLFPFAHTLCDLGYWCGEADDIEDIDRGLYYRIKSNGTEHLAACVIEGVDNKPIACLIVAFDEHKKEMLNHDCEINRESMRHIAMELAVILEVSRYLQ
jgi:hypothetical protein